MIPDFVQPHWKDPYQKARLPVLLTSTGSTVGASDAGAVDKATAPKPAATGVIVATLFS